MDWHKRLPWRMVALCLLALVGALSFSRSATGDTKKLWVAVMEDSPNAVLLKDPDRWADTVTVLKFNEQVDILRTLSEREDNPLPYYKVEVRGFQGYVIQNALADESQLQAAGDEEAKVAVGAAAANNASKGLNKSTENTLRQGDPNYDARVKQVENLEAVVNELMSGTKEGDPVKALKSYRAFGDEGGLINQPQPKKED
jgi:hypothetical protein